MAVPIELGVDEWDPLRTETQCAYCENEITNANRSREDYWPSWLQKKFPHQKGERSLHFTQSTFTGSSETSRGMLGFRRKLKCVCNSCNNGFGSVVQEGAKEAIGRALSRSFRGLSWSQLDALSKWATMFAMTFEFADYATKAITQRTRMTFRETGEIPANVQIWIGRYHGTGFQLNQQHLNSASTFWTGGIPVEKGAKGFVQLTEQLTTIGLGSVFLCVYSYEDLGWNTDSIRQPDRFKPPKKFAKRSIMSISPPRSSLLVKHLTPLNDSELQELAISFLPPAQHSEVRKVTDRPDVPIDFWRSWTSEKDWQ